MCSSVGVPRQPCFQQWGHIIKKTPTNRLFTSLFSPDRLSFLLQYSLAFVNKSDGQHKHAMRYP
ncbi:MAG: hypothetical protein ACOYOE_10555 [Chlorobium sp.]